MLTKGNQNMRKVEILYFLWHHDKKTASTKEIAKEIGLSRQAIRTACLFLASWNYINMQRVRVNPRGKKSLFWTIKPTPNAMKKIKYLIERDYGEEIDTEEYLNAANS